MAETAGVIPRAISEIFSGIRKKNLSESTIVYCSFVQIYKEQVIRHAFGSVIERTPLKTCDAKLDSFLTCYAMATATTLS